MIEIPQEEWKKIRIYQFDEVTCVLFNYTFQKNLNHQKF